MRRDPRHEKVVACASSCRYNGRMPVTRLNHAVLYVRDIDRTKAFYEEALGFETITFMPGQGAFFRAPGSTNDHDLGLLPDRLRRRALRGRPVAPSGSTTWPGRSTRSPSWTACATACSPHGALVGASDHATTKSLYAQDPDGLEFEVCWILPAVRAHPRGHRGRPRQPAPAPARPRRRDRPLRRRHPRRHRRLDPRQRLTGSSVGSRP